MSSGAQKILKLLLGWWAFAQIWLFTAIQALGGVIMLQVIHKQEKACRLSAVFNFTLDKKSDKELVFCNLWI